MFWLKRIVRLKVDWVVVNLFHQTFCFTIYGLLKVQSFLLFSNLKWVLSKVLWKPRSYMVEFECFYKLLLCLKYFWFGNFRLPVKIFWNLNEKRFDYFNFLNKTNVAGWLFLSCSKCANGRNVNVDSSSINILLSTSSLLKKCYFVLLLK